MKPLAFSCILLFKYAYKFIGEFHEYSLKVIFLVKIRKILWKQCRFGQNLDTASYILVILIWTFLKHARNRVYTIINSPMYNKQPTFYA